MTGKKQTILRLLPWLPAMLVFSANSAVVEKNNVDPRIERVRRDLGYFQSGEKQNTDDLKTEIRALHEELRQILERQESRLQRIEDTLKLNDGKEAARQPLPSAKSAPAVPPKGSVILTVCSRGCDFNDLQKAVNAAAPGGKISVAPEINGTCAAIKKPLHIVGKRGTNGRRAHLAGGVCNGKAPLVTAAGNIVIEGFEISNVFIKDGNGACIRLDPGTRDLTVRDIYCHDIQNGVLGASEGRFLIEDSIFFGNSIDKGQSDALYHGLYISGGDEVLIRRSQILSTQNGGHSLKSGARKLTVEDSIIAALNGHNSRALDAYGGGEVTLLRNVIQQGPQSENSDVIGLALEPRRMQPGNHSLRLENNWVIFDNPGKGVLLRGRKLGPITVKNNTFIGLKGMGLDGIQDLNNHWFESRKEAGLVPFDGTASSLPASTAKQ